MSEEEIKPKRQWIKGELARLILARLRDPKLSNVEFIQLAKVAAAIKPKVRISKREKIEDDETPKRTERTERKRVEELVIQMEKDKLFVSK